MPERTILFADLRVNNYYFIGHKITKLTVQILLSSSILDLVEFQGVPLIPSMLDMAGFHEHPDGIFIDKSDRFVIRFWPDGQIHIAFKRAGQRIILPDNVLTELKYLHELQSLYYFLTLEELNIQL